MESKNKKINLDFCYSFKEVTKEILGGRTGVSGGKKSSSETVMLERP